MKREYVSPDFSMQSYQLQDALSTSMTNPEDGGDDKWD